MDFYELGKWLGDRRGFPRVGIINTELTLVLDTAKFLEKEFGQKPIVNTVTQKENPTMLGKLAYETFIVSSKFHRDLENQVANLKPENMKQEDLLAFLAGFIDAEGTVDLKNQQLVISIGKQNKSNLNLIKYMILAIGWQPRIWNCEKEWKISLKWHEELNSLCLRHPDKISRMNNGCPTKDFKYINFIQQNKIVTAQDLANNFSIHIDSARRVLRFLSRIAKIKRLNGERPFKFVPAVV